MDVIQIIDELEQEFATSKNFLWSKKTLVNMDRCASLIAELKANLPSSMQEASYVLSKKEQILATANEDAKKIIADAKSKADKMVSNSELVALSEQRSNAILNDTTRKCAILYNTTKENVDKMLKSVEIYLSDNLQVVKQNRDSLDEMIKKIQNDDSGSRK